MISRFKRDNIVLISFPVLFAASTSFLVNIGKEISLPGFRNDMMLVCLT